MARPRRLRPGAVGLALAAWDIWWRLPPKQRRRLLNLARDNGSRLAAKAMQSRRK
jgi:hypothetical protein